MSNTSINPFFCMAYCSKKCLLEIETVWYQCQSVREPLWHWCQSDGAEMSRSEVSWVRSVDTIPGTVLKLSLQFTCCLFSASLSPHFTVAAAAAAAAAAVVVVVVIVYLHDNNKSVTGMNTIVNLHHANTALTEVHNL